MEPATELSLFPGSLRELSRNFPAKGGEPASVRTDRATRQVTALEETTMKWITRERPKIDRIACPWLIARFIDEQPEFLYVPAPDVFEAARQ